MYWFLLRLCVCGYCRLWIINGPFASQYDGFGQTVYYAPPPIMIESVYQQPPVVGPSPVRIHTEVHTAVTLTPPAAAVIGHFHEGAVIQLYSKVYGRALRIRDGMVDAHGGHGMKGEHTSG